jgi:hypothetical protein
VKAATTSAFRLRRRDLLAIALAPMTAARAVGAQSGASAVRTRPVSTTRFRLGLPEKDWRLLSAGLNTLGSVVHKDGAAAIVIEHELLQIALKPEEVDANFTELEVAMIKERETTGSGFQSRLNPAGRRRAIVDFQRRGSNGPEQVRVFVMVEGKHLYRLVCVAPANQFARYAPIFDAVGGSFTPLDAPA